MTKIAVVLAHCVVILFFVLLFMLAVSFIMKICWAWQDRQLTALERARLKAALISKNPRLWES